MKKILMFLTGLLLIVGAVILIHTKFYLFLGMFPPSVNKIEKTYFENEQELSYISAWFLNNDATDININLLEPIKEMECYVADSQGGFERKTIDITDSELLKQLTILKSKKFLRITKEHNSIYFQIWGSFGGSIGLIFSGDQEPDFSKISAKTKVIEKLPSATNWYYYKIMYE